MSDDIEITCLDCQSTFLFTAADQAFYEEKQFTPPKRCKPCRQIKKDQRGGTGGSSRGGSSGGSFERPSYGGGSRDGGEKKKYDAVCSDCGAATQLPFEPKGNRPVYCRDCFKASRR